MSADGVDNSNGTIDTSYQILRRESVLSSSNPNSDSLPIDCILVYDHTDSDKDNEIESTNDHQRKRRKTRRHILLAPGSPLRRNDQLHRRRIPKRHRRLRTDRQTPLPRAMPRHILHQDADQLRHLRRIHFQIPQPGRDIRVNVTTAILPAQTGAVLSLLAEP